MDDKSNRVGLPIGEFCAAAGFTDSTYYAMPPELRPVTVLIGKAGSRKPKRIACESPAAYLARIAKLQTKPEA